MKNSISNLIIVGGGTAGWLTAAVIAAEHCSNQSSGLQVTLIESPNVKTIGVGEGTWPSMRSTLQRIGLSEFELLTCCDASFKQGSQFINWGANTSQDSYYHPFVAPEGYSKHDLTSYWHSYKFTNEKSTFGHTFSFQPHLCDQKKAPKQLQTPEFAAVANYGYHLNAGKFADLLKKHCTNNLGVTFLSDHVEQVNTSFDNGIESINTKNNGLLTADIYIDCSGSKSLLLGEALGVPFVDKKDILFNDSALALHLPYENNQQEIASHTISTAQSAGWIWDIGLTSRRGIGHVYSQRHISDSKAEAELMKYAKSNVSDDVFKSLEPKKINFNPGHRAKFWHKNCVAVGMSAGFIEPLEASALALVELSAALIRDDLPANKSIMHITAERFNKRFLYRWDKIIDFLKLHYVLSKRVDTEYWRDNKSVDSIPESLQTLLELWRYQAPNYNDLTQTEEVFPAASYQYILYGMGFETLPRAHKTNKNNHDAISQQLVQTQEITNKFLMGLPTNRQLLQQIKQQGLI